MQLPAVILFIRNRAAAGELLSDHLRELGFEVHVAHAASEVGHFLLQASNAVVVGLDAEGAVHDVDTKTLESHRCIWLGPSGTNLRAPVGAQVLTEPFDFDQLDDLIRARAR